VIPVYRVEVGEEFTGATVIEPDKGSLYTVVMLLLLLLVMMMMRRILIIHRHCDISMVVVNCYLAKLVCSRNFS